MNRTESEDSPVEMTVESISPTASDIGSMSDSPVRMVQKKKKRGLSFKKIRSNAQKLLPPAFKKQQKELDETMQPEEGPPSPPPTPILGPAPMQSTESLPAIKEEQQQKQQILLASAKSDDEIPAGGKQAKKARKANRAASFVKKIAGRKSKISPDQSTAASSSLDDENSATTVDTPLSIKRQTPEGANLSLSESSLYESDKQPTSGDSIKIEQLESEPKVIRTIAPKTTEMRITLVNNRSKRSQSEAADNSRASSGVQLPSASASVGPSSASSPQSSSAGAAVEAVDKEVTPGKSVASVDESKPVASSGSAALTLPAKAAAASSERSVEQLSTAAIEPNVIISSGVKSTGITISSLLSGSDRFSVAKVVNVEVPTSRELFFATTVSPKEPLKRSSSSETPTEKLKNIFMKKEAQQQPPPPAKATTASEGSSQKSQTQSTDPSPAVPELTLSTVRTQEAAKPYQLAGNNIKNPNLPGFKSSETLSEPEDKPTAESKSDAAIVFNIGSQVRADRTSSAKQTGSGGSGLLAPLLVPDSGAQSGSFNQQKSLEEYGSFEARSSLDDGPLSENSRRRIAYVAQPTLFTPEEEELVTGRPSLLAASVASEFSQDSADFLDKKMSPHGDLLLEKNDSGSNMSTSPSEKREHLYKILVIGELGTGKTSFIKRYVHQFFSENYRATIGVDFALKVLNWDQNTIIRLQLWDIAGQERFGNMTRVYYKEAVGAFIVFDITRSATFDAVIKWKQDLDSKVQLPDGKPIPCILLANKCDQQKSAKLDDYVKEHGFAGWFETSAKANTNIEEAAKCLVNKILMNDKQINSGESVDSDRFALAGGKTDPVQKKSCAC